MSKSALLPGVLLAALLGTGIVTPPSAGRAEPPARETREEALFGSYWCSAGASDGYLSLSFNATGDVLDAETYLSRMVTVATTPSETCGLHTAAALSSLSAGPCTLGAVEIRTDEYGETRSFQFVCRAGRAGIVRTLADVSAVLLTSSP